MKTQMWFLLLTILLFSQSSLSRNLECSLHEKGWGHIIATQKANLDVKPTFNKTWKRTWEEKSVPITLQGNKGKLRFWIGATWYNNHPSGNIKLNNMNDTFPAIDAGVFFYKQLSNGSYENTPSLVGIRSDSAPGFNEYANGISDPSHVLYGWSSMDDYSLRCEVH